MSTEFNPATFEHEGVVYEARSPFDDEGSCGGCAFDFQGSGLRMCLHPCTPRKACISPSRPDLKNIIWVRAQEGKKA